MIIIACVDENLGMAFHNRRQSRDRAVTRRILQICGNKKLWMEPYSEKLFAEETPAVWQSSEAFLEEAGSGEFCFAERVSPANAAEKIEEIILFEWNRTYPSDVKLDFDLSEWELTELEEFPGFSHEKITRKRYRKKR